MLEYTNQTNIPGALLALDYSKAYDSISKEFMLEAFQFYNLGDNFLTWLKVIMTNTMSCVSYCGWLSNWFMLERGIRQGCPLSPLLFILAVEIFASKVRQCRSINGIKIPFQLENREIKILQFADDTSLILSNEESITNSLQLVKQFSRISGLCLKNRKTQAIWVGCWKFRKKNVGDIKWNVTPDNFVKILGITFNSEKRIEYIRENWQKRLIKCQNIIKTWKSRRLTINGRIMLVKSLLASQISYMMQCTILPDLILNRFNTLFFKYIWSQGDLYKEEDIKKIPERLKRIIIIQDYEKGGLKIIV